MTTGNQVQTFLRQRFGDTDGNFLTDGLTLTLLDQAQNQIVTEFMELRRYKGFTTSAYQEAFSIPTDCIMIEVAWHARNLKRVLTKTTPAEFFRRQQVVDGAVGDPVIWTEMEGKVYVWPRYASASNTTTITATMAITGDPIIATVGQLTAKGIVRIDSEDIEYTNKGTSGTLGGVIRGSGGTTAATHASAATVTQLDFQLLYRRTAASLSTIGETLDVTSNYRQLLEAYCLYLAYLAEGSQQKAADQFKVYEKMTQQQSYSAEKADLSGNIRIQDAL